LIAVLDHHDSGVNLGGYQLAYPVEHSSAQMPPWIDDNGIGKLHSEGPGDGGCYLLLCDLDKDASFSPEARHQLRARYLDIRNNLVKPNYEALQLIVAHADDPAIFAGGVLALFVRAGWQVHALRVTDDRWDSVGMDEAETITRNAAEFRAAAAVLGLAGVKDLGWQTDVLGDVSRVGLRERLIHERTALMTDTGEISLLLKCPP